MATSTETMEFLLDQLSELKSVRTRKMFGEYALYLDEKVVALVCDDHLFVKPTEDGKKFLGRHFKEGIAYPGAKPSMLIGAELIDDHEKLSELVRITAASLPPPKQKKKRRAKKV